MASVVLTLSGQYAVENALRNHNGDGRKKKIDFICSQIQIDGESLSPATFYRILDKKRSKLSTVQPLFSYLGISENIIGDGYANEERNFDIRRATQSQLRWIASAENMFFNTDIQNQYTTLSRWYKANPHGFFVVIQGGEVIGSLVVVAIKEPKLSQFLKGNIKEEDIEGIDIYSEGEAKNATSIYIESLMIAVVDAEQRSNIFLRIFNTHANLLNDVYNYSAIKIMYALAASDISEALLNKAGKDLHLVSSDRKDGRKMYSIPIGAIVKLRKNL
jgi:hypothetical protein